MTNNDKVLAAFLVSVGLFTANCANQYVRSLTTSAKAQLLTVAVGNTGNIALCDASPEVGRTQVNETKSAA